MCESWWEMGRRLRKQYKRECKWNSGRNCEVQSSSGASLGVLTSLPIPAANFLLPSEILSQKHRTDLVIKHICLNHTIVSSPNLYAFVNLLPCWGSGRKQIVDICVRVANRLVWPRLGTKVRDGDWQWVRHEEEAWKVAWKLMSSLLLVA